MNNQTGAHYIPSSNDISKWTKQNGEKINNVWTSYYVILMRCETREEQEEAQKYIMEKFNISRMRMTLNIQGKQVNKSKYNADGSRKITADMSKLTEKDHEYLQTVKKERGVSKDIAHDDVRKLADQAPLTIGHVKSEEDFHKPDMGDTNETRS